MDFSALSLAYDICIMSALIVVAKIARTKIKIFQDWYIPTALLAGIMGVVLGPYGFALLPFSSQASSYAGILIVVLFATMYLGKNEKASFKEMFKRVGDSFLLNGAAELFQYGIALVLGTVLLSALFPDVNPWFSVLMPAGFVGGHGTAAAMGSVFGEAGWSEALSIGQTFATVGLLGGIFGGIAMINFCARRGYTEIIRSAAKGTESNRSGLVPEGERVSMGSNTVNPMSLDPLAWHVALIMVAVGGAYLVNMGLKALFPSVSVPVYGIALVAGVAFYALLKPLGLASYVDRDVVSRIGSCATDYLVAFGVATINLGVVLQYWLPILVLSLIGFASVWVFFILASRHLFGSYWVERGIFIWGWMTGVMSIAVLLLRVVDPEFKSGVLEDSGFAWIFVSFIDVACVTFVPLFVIAGTGVQAGIVLCLAAAAMLAAAAFLYGVYNNQGKKVFPRA